MATAAQRAAVAKFKMAVAYRKKHPGISQKEAFEHVYGKKKVSGTARKKKPVRRSYKQTGTSVKALDKKVQAKKPGKRTTTWGTTYTETRANRSDRGRMLGTPKTLSGYMAGAKKILSEKLGRLEAGKFMAKKKSDKMRFAREIRAVKLQLKKFL